jgi:hypothetical protein
MQAPTMAQIPYTHSQAAYLRQGGVAIRFLLRSTQRPRLTHNAGERRCWEEGESYSPLVEAQAVAI